MLTPKYSLFSHIQILELHLAVQTLDDISEGKTHEFLE